MEPWVPAASSTMSYSVADRGARPPAVRRPPAGRSGGRPPDRPRRRGARAAAMVHSPMGPAPMTSTRAPGSTPARLMPWTATASGSTRQASSEGEVGRESLGARGVDPRLVGQAAVEADPVHGPECRPGTAARARPGSAGSGPHRTTGRTATGVPSSSRPQNSWPRVTVDGPNETRCRSDPQIPELSTDTRTPPPGSRRCPPPGCRPRWIALLASLYVPADGGAVGDGEHVGVGAHDP